MTLQITVYSKSACPQCDTAKKLLQARNLPLPVYELVATHGEDHARCFDVTCSAGHPPLTAAGSAGSRRAAEQSAAAQVLERLAGAPHAD